MSVNGIGRPREPIKTKWAGWKRAARDHGRPGNNWITHHVDGKHGKGSAKVQVMSRAAHAKVHRKKAIKRQLSR